MCARCSGGKRTTAWLRATCDRPQSGQRPRGDSAAPGLVLRHDVFACHSDRPLVYLYLILDLYSRKSVGWEVHAEDDSDHAAHLVRRTAFAEGIATCATKPVLHGDNGATLKAEDSPTFKVAY